MEIGIICSNLVEKSHHSSNPGQKPGSNFADHLMISGIESQGSKFMTK
jgi:hypothetical protein